MPVDPFTGELLDPYGEPVELSQGLPPELQGSAQLPPELQFPADDFSAPGVTADAVTYTATPSPMTPPPMPAAPGGYGQSAWNPGISAALARDQQRSVVPGDLATTADVAALQRGQEGRLNAAYFGQDVAGPDGEPQRLAGVDETQRAAAETEARGMAARADALQSRLKMEQGIESADRAAHEISVAEVKSARGRLEQQLAANRALSVDPTLNFTAGESLGNAASLFAQGFLQAGYGIKIDVAGTLDRWTDRYVDNQMEKIRRGDRIADQDRAVWEMVRAEASDEQDARDRYKTFAMSQAATSMEIEASRWGSELARARGAEQSAQARMALAQHMNTQETGWYDRLQGAKKAEFDRWATRQQLSIARQNANTAAAKTASDPKANDVIIDPTTKNVFANIVASGKNAPDKVREDFGKTFGIATKINRAMATMGKYGPTLLRGGDLFNRFVTTPEGALLQSDLADIKTSIARRDFGTAQSKQELEQLVARLGDGSILTRADTQRTLAKLGRQEIEGLVDRNYQYLRDPDTGGAIDPSRFADSFRAMWQLTEENAAAPKSRAAELGGQIRAPGQEDFDAPLTAFVRDVRSTPTATTDPFEGQAAARAERRRQATGRVESWFLPMESLARDLYSSPAPSARGEGAEDFTPEGAKALRDNALQELKLMAYGAEADKQPDRRAAAQETLTLFNRDPERMAKALGVEWDPWK